MFPLSFLPGGAVPRHAHPLKEGSGAGTLTAPVPSQVVVFKEQMPGQPLAAGGQRPQLSLLLLPLLLPPSVGDGPPGRNEDPGPQGVKRDRDPPLPL